MENNLPKKYKFSFINGIKKFFFKILKKQEIDSNENLVEQEKNIVSKDNDIETMKHYSTNAKLKNDIVELLMKKPDIIDTFPEEKLDELEKICSEKVKENDRVIKRLKNKCERLDAKLGNN